MELSRRSTVNVSMTSLQDTVFCRPEITSSFSTYCRQPEAATKTLIIRDDSFESFHQLQLMLMTQLLERMMRMMVMQTTFNNIVPFNRLYG